MSETNVISVNPSQKTLGILYAEGNVNRLRFARRIALAASRVPDVKDTLRFLSGISSRTGKALSVKALTVRVLFCAVFAGMGAIQLVQGGDVYMAYAMIAFGAMALLGLLTRISATGAACWFGWQTAMAGMAMQIDQTSIAMTLACLVLAVMGPGIYSVDQLIRHGAMRIRRRAIRRKGTRIYRSLHKIP